MLKRALFAVLLALTFAAHAAVNALPWGPKPQFVDANGAPMSGGTLQTLAAGSSTPRVTYTDSTGGTGNPTTITLNTRGETPNEVWLTSGLSYKLILKDAAGATVWTVDGIVGVNDVSGSIDEWKASALTPTFVSGTSFTLAGDQTVEFHVGRRVKTTNSGGTVYGTITAAAFAVSTTVTVVNDSSALDGGLSAVSLGILRATNPSVNADFVRRKGAAVTSAGTTNIWAVAGDFVHVTGVNTITSFGTAPYAGSQRTVITDSALTITYNATTLQTPGAQSITTQAGDQFTVVADTTANAIITHYQRAAQSPTTRGVIAAGRNIAARTNSATPNTKIDISADELQLEDTNGNVFVAKSLSCTIDFGTTGANGLDAGTQVLSTWYYGWGIAKPDGTLACLGSTSTSAPTMPSGYTFKALATAARSDASVHFLKYRQLGNTVYYESQQSVLAAGAAGGETAVSTASFVPPNALSVSIFVENAGTPGAAGQIDGINIRLISGSDYNIVNATGQINGVQVRNSCAMEIPNISQSLLYGFITLSQFTVAHAANIWVTGFKLPMGGE